MSYFNQMGPIAYPLVLCSVVVLAIVIERLGAFFSSHPLPTRLMEQLLEAKPLNEDSPVCRQLPQHGMGPLFQLLIRSQHKDKDEVEEALSIRLMEVEDQLNRNLPVLKILAAISPLLGLLGTILGMISAFNEISHFDGPITPSLIADGISQALLTTAGGLIVAIPALTAHAFYRLRSQTVMRRLTQQLNVVLHHLYHA